eukprot:Pompholyxophrys_punicea_v1_NODE_127_length_3306_cov_27.855737.p4 type:complete len:125 gc:universal NODE_127_length_3306_cov_27.855737:1737-2111(+)
MCSQPSFKHFIGMPSSPVAFLLLRVLIHLTTSFKLAGARKMDSALGRMLRRGFVSTFGRLLARVGPMLVKYLFREEAISVSPTMIVPPSSNFSGSVCRAAEFLFSKFPIVFHVLRGLFAFVAKS